MEHKIFAIIYNASAEAILRLFLFLEMVQLTCAGFGGYPIKELRIVLQNSLTELGSMKASILVQAQLEKDGEHVTAMLRSKSLVILESTDINSALRGALEVDIRIPLPSYTREGSGWVEEEAESIDISTARYVLMKGRKL